MVGICLKFWSTSICQRPQQEVGLWNCLLSSTPCRYSIPVAKVAPSINRCALLIHSKWIGPTCAGMFQQEQSVASNSDNSNSPIWFNQFSWLVDLSLRYFHFKSVFSYSRGSNSIDFIRFVFRVKKTSPGFGSKTKYGAPKICQEPNQITPQKSQVFFCVFSFGLFLGVIFTGFILVKFAHFAFWCCKGQLETKPWTNLS